MPSCGRPAGNDSAAATQQRLAFCISFACQILPQNDWEQIQPQQGINGGIHFKIPIVSCLMQPREQRTEWQPTKSLQCSDEKKENTGWSPQRKKSSTKGEAASRERHNSSRRLSPRTSISVTGKPLACQGLLWGALKAQTMGEAAFPLCFISFPSVCVCP